MIKPDEIVVVSLHTPDIFAYSLRTTAKMREYATKHGYACVISTEVDATRPPSWSKIKLAMELLRDDTYKWLFWIDADAVITDPTRDLREFITPDADLIIGGRSKIDKHRVNMGIWFLRNCDASRRFLDLVWNWDGDVFNRFWEQAAVHNLLLHDPTLLRLSVRPRSDFNSHRRDWLPGQFIIHFSGTAHNDRVELINSVIDEMDLTGTTNFTRRKPGAPVTPLEKIKKLDQLRAQNGMPPVSFMTPDNLDKISGKDLVLGRSNDVTEPKKEEPPTCIHRGEATGQMLACKPCAGRRSVEVFSCGVYGSCTVSRKIDGFPVCDLTCAWKNREIIPCDLASSAITVFSINTADISGYSAHTAAALKRYADLHGYECVISNETDTSRPESWSKIPLALELMKDTRREWLFWIDADAVITTPDVPLQKFIKDDLDLILTDDPPDGKGSPFSFGVWFARNCAVIREFLQRVWDWPGNKLTPWWEQTAAHQVIEGIEDIRYEILPRTTFNSFSSEWYPTHFVCHFAGKSHEVRCKEIPEMVRKTWIHRTLDSGPTSDWFDYQEFYNREAADIPPESHIAEVGCWLGRSTVYLAGQTKDQDVKIHAIDTWDQSTRSPEKHILDELRLYGGMTQKEIFDANVGAAGFRDRITTWVSGSAAAADHFADESLDFVFIDADHSYEAIKADILAWFPKVRAGGVLAGHDYRMPSVAAAVDETLPNAVVDYTGQQCWKYQKLAPSYVICFTPRSGSTVLSYGLRDVGLGNPDAYFGHSVGTSGDKKTYKELSPTRTPEQLFRDFQRMGYLGGMSGIKTTWRPMVPVMDLILSKLPTCKYIFLTRKNLVRQAISRVKAKQTKIWTTDQENPPRNLPVFMKEAIDDAILTAVKEQEQWELFFQQNKITPFRLEYETIEQDFSAALGSVVRFLAPERRFKRVPPPRLEKMADDINERWYLDVIRR